MLQNMSQRVREATIRAIRERPPLDVFLAALPENAVVCDVGGGGSRRERANWVIDILPWETRGSPSVADLVTREQWIVHDICKRPWPIPDDFFDFTICSHTLEDVRDPIQVIAELMRVSPCGYVETPGRAFESARSPYGLVPGCHHHRWLVETAADGTLMFTHKDGRLTEFKAFQVHRRVGLSDNNVRLYWERDVAPLRGEERLLMNEADFIRFRSRFEGVSEERLWRLWTWERTAKRCYYKAMRCLQLR